MLSTAVEMVFIEEICEQISNHCKVYSLCTLTCGHVHE